MAMLHEHERRIEDLEDKVSETRSAVVGIDKNVAVVLEQLKTMDARWGWVIKMVFAAICGISGIVGLDIWRLLKELPK